jgi:hypothetical protein
MQREMIAEVESAKPKFILDVRSSGSWLARVGSETYILGWMDSYIAGNYNLVGIVDIFPPDLSVYKWHEDAKNYQAHSPASVLIYERK